MSRLILAAPHCAEAAPLRRIAVLVPTVRIRGVSLEEWARRLDRAPTERRAVLLAALATVERALHHLHPSEGRLDLRPLPLHTAYPRVPLEIAARLVLGERPTDLAPGLTRTEAHAWLVDGALDVVPWYLERHGIEGVEGISDLRVAIWLVARMRSPEQRAALERPRREVLAGQLIEGRYLDRVDELRRADLRPSVEDTFRRAAVRLAKALEKSLLSKGGEPLAPEPKWWRPIRCARLIRTGPDLVSEGRALDHCVAVYAGVVQERRSAIVGICVLGQRSTAEIDLATLAIRQHKGVGNGAPPALCAAALVVCLRRWMPA